MLQQWNALLIYGKAIFRTKTATKILLMPASSGGSKHHTQRKNIFLIVIIKIQMNEFLLKKAGQTWDNVIEEDATFDDIDEPTIKKVSAQSRRSRAFA
jgi:hypothetical protein